MEDNTLVSALAADENEADARTVPFGQRMSAPAECDDDFVKVGGLYEIDHGELPRRSPIHLKKIRVVMVSEKTVLNVSVNFPSLLSLRKYFCEDSESKPSSMELDEQFVMGRSQARKVLHRRINSLVLSQSTHLKSFWLVAPTTTSLGEMEGAFPSDSCSNLEITCAGLPTWGCRRRVRFVTRHPETPLPSSLLRPDLTAPGTMEIAGLKRRREGKVKDRWRKKCKPALEEKTVNFNSKDRWSKERYEAAELKLLDIMREKGAFIGNPILRPALRMEARKHIGDTGLLDHLLKHMAGMVDQKRGERLRRQHNSEGHMEYWLESAELVELRRLAGVKDPYWIPPHGWKPGDNPYHDPETTSDLKHLREEMCQLKRDLEPLLQKKRLNEQGDANESLVSLKETCKRLHERDAILEDELKGVREEMKQLWGKLKKEDMEEEEKVAENGIGRRAKSGFRICKPQGTFLWPNMGGNTISPRYQLMQIEDLLGAPTPSSASSSTSPPFPLLPATGPTSPVKPRPQKNPVAIPETGTDMVTWNSGNGRSCSASVDELTRAWSPVVEPVRGNHLSEPGTWLALATPEPSAPLKHQRL